jgi:hypothetical protein
LGRSFNWWVGPLQFRSLLRLRLPPLFRQIIARCVRVKVAFRRDPECTNVTQGMIADPLARLDAIGETQLKPFFFADETNFTATCIPPLNQFSTSRRPRGSVRSTPGDVHPWRGATDACNTTSLEEQPVKTCVQCQGKLGLGMRARNLWNGRWWSHVYFCSARCEDRYGLEQSEANAKPRWRELLCSR